MVCVYSDSSGRKVNTVKRPTDSSKVRKAVVRRYFKKIVGGIERNLTFLF